MNGKFIKLPPNKHKATYILNVDHIVGVVAGEDSDGIAILLSDGTCVTHAELTLTDIENKITS